MKYLSSKLPSWFDGRATATVLVTKALVLLFGIQVFEILENRSVNWAGGVLGIWQRWDAVHYLKLAQEGYGATGDNRFLIVFFPLYPLIVSIFGGLIGNHLVGAFFVTGLASVALGLSLRELVRLDHSEKVAQLSVIFLFIFPTSYFLHIPYTESLFLALTIGSFLAARKHSWLLAAILGGLACATRVNGLILVPALAFEVWQEYRETDRVNLKWLFLLIIPSGFVAYLLLNYVVAGDPLIFLTYQREHWYRYFRWPWQGIWETIKLIDNPKTVDSHMMGIQELLFVLIGIGALLIGWRELRASYRVWMGLNWLLFVSTSFVISVPRYTLTLFPIFILMAIAARRYASLNVLLIVWSILFLGAFVSQFVRGMWAF
ncbi:MAG: glycosyltransferase family 39 protein [Pyrinomonadaceae bacterium]